MPSTLTHVALQVPAARVLGGAGAVPWVLASCIIPDIAWILQRAFKAVWWGSEEIFYDVRLLAIAQSSLLLSGVLCAALAIVARPSGRALLALLLGCAVHLLLDALQLRWGNGVHLGLPFVWTAWSPGSVDPDAPAFAAVALVGAAACVFLIARPPRRQELQLTRGRLTASVALVAAFFVLPWVLMAPLERADNHSIGSLRAEQRHGREVSLYRAHYFPPETPGGDPVLLTLVSEPLRVTSGLDLAARARVSVRGRFAGPDRLEVIEAHVHPHERRSIYSVLGLALSGWILARWAWQSWRRPLGSRSPQAAAPTDRS